MPNPETTPVERATEFPILNEDQQLFLAKLRASGWMIVAPGCVGVPRNAIEARAMNLISESYLKSHEAKEINHGR